MERIIALVLFVSLLPLLILLYLFVKLTSKGSFIFHQKRVGKDFKIFTMYKIRTMIEGAEKIKQKIKHLNEVDGPVFKIENDPRYTTVGKYLANTGLDETLQLINIICGEMSFVGPRPLPIDEAQKVPKKYSLRFTVNPGITSLWVIKGAHKLPFDQWMKSDIEYIKKKNFLLDFKIIFLTLLLCLKSIVKRSF